MNSLLDYSQGRNAMRTSLDQLTFRVVEPLELPQTKREVQQAFVWDTETLEVIFADHDTGGSTTILQYEAGRLVGIVTIRWHSTYPPFREHGIPLIQNIEIRYHDRGRGLGNALLERAEQEIAQRSAVAGLCVGIFDEYGRAQRLYMKRGFVPDGRGVCKDHTPLRHGENVRIDHNLLLWLTKDVSDMLPSTSN
jgi:GNAT superfamily N-acetyltransferase